MSKKILILGGSSDGVSELLHQTMKEKYGEDIVLVTPDEAKEQGLKAEDFDNIPTFKLTAPELFNHPVGISFSGQESRRKRRMNERKYKNNKKK